MDDGPYDPQPPELTHLTGFVGATVVSLLLWWLIFKVVAWLTG